MNTRFGTIKLAIEKNSLIEYSILAGITIIAMALRFYKLGEWSFWGDEVFSISGRPDGFFLSLSVRLIQLTINWLGISEWSARLVPAIIGTVSIPLLYFPVRKQFGIWVGLLFASMLAVSPWHLYWSQNARFYVLLLLLYTFTLLAFYIGIEEDKPWYIVASLVLFGLAVQERLMALMFILIAVVYLVCIKLLRFDKPVGLNRRNVLIFFVPIVVLGLWFAFPFLRDLPGWIAGFGRINNNPIWILSGTFFYITLPVVFLAGAGMIYYLLEKNRGVLFFCLAGLIPLIVIVILSVVQYTANRYAFIALTSWLILASIGLYGLASLLSGRAIIFSVAIYLLILGTAFSDSILYYQYQNGNRDNWKAAYNYIQQHKGSNDLVVSGTPQVGSYYLKDQVIGYPYLSPDELKRYDRIWLVEDLNVKDLYPSQRAWMLDNAQLVAVFDNHVSARTYPMRVYQYLNKDEESLDQ
jgi:Dolichyl-phosphate-mannose-protein mannosyltransferase